MNGRVVGGGNGPTGHPSKQADGGNPSPVAQPLPSIGIAHVPIVLVPSVQIFICRNTHGDVGQLQ